MTTTAARNTPFHLLVVMSDHTSTTGELFLDDGVEMNMGGDSETWSLVKFSATSGKNGVTITSSVAHRGFAMSHKGVIDKITILGLRRRVKIKTYMGAEATKIAELGVTSSFRNQQGFVVSEISDLRQLIGRDFKLQLKFEGAT